MANKKRKKDNPLKEHKLFLHFLFLTPRAGEIGPSVIVIPYPVNLSSPSSIRPSLNHRFPYRSFLNNFRVCDFFPLSCPIPYERLRLNLFPIQSDSLSFSITPTSISAFANAFYYDSFFFFRNPS